MKIILSPTKQMMKEEIIEATTTPKLINRVKPLVNYLQTLTYDELKDLLKCNDQLTQIAYNYYQHFSYTNVYPSLFTFNGIAFKYLSPSTLENDSLTYLNQHLYILSGLYGILKASDGISLYRLELGSKLVFKNKNLYEYFSSDVKSMIEDEDFIINLASKEYAKLIEDNINAKTKLINIDFVEEVKGKLKTKATSAKMARGAMLRYMAINQITDLNELKGFNELGFKYADHKSNSQRLVFIK